MDKSIREIIYIIVAILISVLAIKLFIWLLPIIIVLLLANYIYKKLKNINIKTEKDTVETIKKSKTKNYTKSKTKKIIIIDEENND